eukprot:6205833-Pleurochrysis_carterae.AAC.1
MIGEQVWTLVMKQFAAGANLQSARVCTANASTALYDMLVLPQPERGTTDAITGQSAGSHQQYTPMTYERYVAMLKAPAS